MATGTPVVMVLLTGRPYAIDWALDAEPRPGAVLQAFFPGEEGAPAIAVDPRGRDHPERATAGLAPALRRVAAVLVPASDPGRPERDHEREQRTRCGRSASGSRTPRSRTPTSSVDATARTDDAFTVSVRVRNDGSRAGTDVVQLYARDVYASVTRPVAQLLGYARVALDAGQEAVVEFDVPTARLAFTSRGGERIVEPGAIRLWVGAVVRRSRDDRRGRAHRDPFTS